MQSNKIKRVFLIVLDSFGCGAAPDAAEFGDAETCSTLRSVTESGLFPASNLTHLGIYNIDGVQTGTPDAAPIGAHARLRELSRGKDTTTGHWEMAGIVSSAPMPTYPNGFPPEIIEQLEAAFGRKILCNKPYSGTEVIHDYGQEHEETGALIVYTSADSVLQIAAHEDHVPVEALYEYCRKARIIMQGEHGVGRIIARPFIGSYPNYTRTSRRHDFSLDPTGDTVLDALSRTGYDVIGIGKTSDIFGGRGLTRSLGVNETNADGMRKTTVLLAEDFTGLAFINLVDGDMIYGHRRDIPGYARAMQEFDDWLTDFLPAMHADDVLMITADHGCDPGAAGSDHTREYVPLLIYGKQIAPINLGTYPTFAMIGATVADMFGAQLTTKGESFLPRVLK